MTTMRADAKAVLDVTGAGIEIRVLGPIEVAVDDTPAARGGPKQRGVLATLIKDVGRVVSLDQIVDGVWGDQPPSAVRNSIHTYIFRTPSSSVLPRRSHPIRSVWSLEDLDLCTSLTWPHWFRVRRPATPSSKSKRTKR